MHMNFACRDGAFSGSSNNAARGAVLLGVLFGTTAMPAAALAQPTVTAAGAESTVALNADGVSATDAAPVESSQGLSEIVVTATKRETNLQKTPIAINVASAENLADRHAQSLVDLADGSIPSLRVATFEARHSALTVGIRGIVPFDANQTARDQGVGVYIDGIYMARQQGLNAALLDIDRIEVLKGPQGTLFGRNTEGGALNIVTRVPGHELDIRAKVGAGNYGQYNAEGHVTIPVGDTLSFKFDGIVQHQDETVKNPLEGQVGWNYHHTVGGRAAVRWTPTDALTVDLAYDRTHDENTPNYSQLVNFNPNDYPVGHYVGTSLVCPTGATFCVRPLSPIVTVSGGKRQDEAEIGVPQQPSIDRTQGFTGILKYKLNPDLEFRSITGWRKVSTHQWDNSGGAHRSTFVPNANFSRYSLSELFQHQWSQEFQLVGSFTNVDYVLGGYYFTEKVREAAATPSTNKWNADGTGYIINSPDVLPPISSSNQGWQREDWFVARDSNAKATSWAAFGQATWSPIDVLHLTAGARYTHDKRDGALTIFNNKPANFPFTYSKGRVDPLAVVSFDAARNVHLYAKYSTGFRAGGANSRSQTFSAFGPETVKAYEVGAKTDLFDHMVRFNVAAYMMRRKGTQTDFDFVDTRRYLDEAGTIANPNYNRHYEETANAPGTSKIKGFEADLAIRPIWNLELGGSYAYTDIKVPPTPNPFLPGNPPFQVYTVFTPKHAASGYIDYEVPGDIAGGKLRFHLDANYSSRQYSFQSESAKTDPSFIVNGRVALADIPLSGDSAQMTLSVWARNLLNETHIYRRSAANSTPVIDSISGAANYGGVLGDYANFNPPRTFGIEAAFKIGERKRMPVVEAPVLPSPPSAPVTQTCADGSVILASDACPVPPPPPVPQAPEVQPERG
nr:TonB-dependent receptor [uncultured Sphingomonas sp.]